MSEDSDHHQSWVHHAELIPNNSWIITGCSVRTKQRTFQAEIPTSQSGHLPFSRNCREIFTISWGASLGLLFLSTSAEAVLRLFVFLVVKQLFSFQDMFEHISFIPNRR